MRKKQVDINKIIAQINITIDSLGVRHSEKDLIIAFEKIEKYVSKSSSFSDLYGLPIAMKHHKDYKRLDTFFKKAAAVIRKKAEQSKFYQENLIAIGLANFKETSKVFSKYPYTYYSMNYDVAHAAYQYTLDQYDPNKISNSWAGFWSLISTKNGQITGVYLSDTADREYFWEFVKKNGKTILNKINHAK